MPRIAILAVSIFAVALTGMFTRVKNQKKKIKQYGCFCGTQI